MFSFINSTEAAASLGKQKKMKGDLQGGIISLCSSSHLISRNFSAVNSCTFFEDISPRFEISGYLKHLQITRYVISLSG